MSKFPKTNNTEETQIATYTAKLARKPISISKYQNPIPNPIKPKNKKQVRQ
jgi:hypothetical protein